MDFSAPKTPDMQNLSEIETSNVAPQGDEKGIFDRFHFFYQIVPIRWTLALLAI